MEIFAHTTADIPSVVESKSKYNDPKLKGNLSLAITNKPCSLVFIFHWMTLTGDRYLSEHCPTNIPEIYNYIFIT